MSNSQRVAAWATEKLPGPFDAETPQECIEAAYMASGLDQHMSMDDFETALDLVGFKPVCIRQHSHIKGDRDSKSLYRLRLPEPSPGVRARG